MGTGRDRGGRSRKEEGRERIIGGGRDGIAGTRSPFLASGVIKSELSKLFVKIKPQINCSCGITPPKSISLIFGVS